MNIRRKKSAVLTENKARTVAVSILFTRLGEIDTINEKFSCEATIFVTWNESESILQSSYTTIYKQHMISPKDGTNDPISDDNKEDKNSGEENEDEDEYEETFVCDLRKLWDPQLYVDNAIGDVKEKDVKYNLKKLYDMEKRQSFVQVNMIKRIQGTFFEKLELYHFPFDVQDLSLTITSHRPIDEIIIVRDSSVLSKMTKSASLDKHIWTLYDHINFKTHVIKNDLMPTSEYSSEELHAAACSHSAITAQCRVSRKPGYFVINCLLPTLMITLCVFFTFLMEYSRKRNVVYIHIMLQIVCFIQ
jgi:hypothetical protein